MLLPKGRRVQMGCAFASEQLLIVIGDTASTIVLTFPYEQLLIPHEQLLLVMVLKPFHVCQIMEASITPSPKKQSRNSICSREVRTADRQSFTFLIPSGRLSFGKPLFFGVDVLPAGKRVQMGCVCALIKCLSSLVIRYQPDFRGINTGGPCQT